VFHDGKATALRVQIHWDTNRVCAIVVMTKVNIARKAAALADNKLEDISGIWTKEDFRVVSVCRHALSVI